MSTRLLLDEIVSVGFVDKGACTEADIVLWKRDGTDPVAKYDPDQPRDERGRFGEGGGGGPAGGDGARGESSERPRFTPTDAKGNKISTGSRVRVSRNVGGGRGTVQSISPSGTHSVVELSSGKTRSFDNSDLTVEKSTADATKRQFSQERREELAEEGKAMPDGSYPIATAADLRNAVQSYGRAKNPGAVKAHIVRRAKALGLTDALPDGWVTKEDAVNIDKVGRKMTAARLAQLKASLEGLNALLAEVDDAVTDDPATEGAPMTDTAIKHDTPPVAGDPPTTDIPTGDPPTTDTPTGDDVEKADLRKRMEMLEKRAAAAEATAAAERDLRLEREWVAKAGDFRNLPLKADAFGPLLKRAAEALSETDMAEVLRVLKAADTAIAGAFTELGRGQDVTGTAREQIAALAKAAMEKDPSLTLEAARVAVRRQNPELRQQERDEARASTH